MVARKKYEVPVFHPTLRDLGGSFETFVESVERRFAQVGICKIVAPKSWTPRKAGYDDDNIECEIPRPIRQHATGTRGLYRTLLVEAKPMSLLKDFKPLATHKHNLPPENADTEAVERAFWRSVTISPPLYGADVPGSMFDEDLKGWNLRHLDSLLSRTLSKNDLDAIPGVNTPYLYFGMWRSIFAWHTEDLDLHSINYLHYGAPKTWYCIPPAHRERFEVLVKGLLPDLFRSCPEFFRHKELLISPQMLQAHNIPVVKVTQYPGEFIINYPGAYHAGFNHGYNCAESTNFATRSWIGIGAQARVCDCHSDAVKIEMRMFLDEANPRAKRILRDNLSDTESSESESEGESEDESDSDDSSDEDAPAPRRKRAKVAATACKAAASGGRSMTADKPTARRALVSGGRNMAAAKPTSSVHGRGGQAPGNKRARVDSTARAPASKRRKTAEGSASARKPGRSPGGPAKPAKQSAAQQSGAKSNSKTAAAKSQPGKPQGTTAVRSKAASNASRTSSKSTSNTSSRSSFDPPSRNSQPGGSAGSPAPRSTTSAGKAGAEQRTRTLTQRKPTAKGLAGLGLKRKTPAQKAAAAAKAAKAASKLQAANAKAASAARAARVKAKVQAAAALERAQRTNSLGSARSNSGGTGTHVSSELGRAARMEARAALAIKSSNPSQPALSDPSSRASNRSEAAAVTAGPAGSEGYSAPAVPVPKGPRSPNPRRGSVQHAQIVRGPSRRTSAARPSVRAAKRLRAAEQV